MTGVLFKKKQVSKLGTLAVNSYKLKKTNLFSDNSNLPNAYRKTRRFQSLVEALKHCQLKSGVTVSFHHHFRNGDQVISAVMDCLADMGIQNLTLAASSIFPCHGSLVRHIETGVIDKIYTDYMAGPVGEAVIDGKLKHQVIFQSHGGRARAISSGELKIDIAIVGASLANSAGDATGRAGAMPCGPLGYAMVDAAFADKTLILTDQIIDGDLPHVDIPGSQVDGILHFPEPGSPTGISFGSTKRLQTPEAIKIGNAVADIVRASDILKPGFSFQTGAGGFSLSCVPPIGDLLRKQGLRANFLAGGITAAHVKILEEGLASEIRDVQCFDQDAVRSSMKNKMHRCMSASEYASPSHPNPSTSELSLVVLGAAEVDAEYNVNVLLGGNGAIIGGPGGHPDTAAGADITIVTTRLNGGGYAKVVEKVNCICTPGKDVDAIVTDEGIAINPNNEALTQALQSSGIKTVTIQELIESAAAKATKSRMLNKGPEVGIVEAPNGDVIDVVRGR